MEKNNVDWLTGQKIPQFTTILWLPNKNGYKKGIAISIDSFNSAMMSQDAELIEKLNSVGLYNLIDWENGGY